MLVALCDWTSPPLAKTEMVLRPVAVAVALEAVSEVALVGVMADEAVRPA